VSYYIVLFVCHALAPQARFQTSCVFIACVVLSAQVLHNPESLLGGLFEHQLEHRTSKSNKVLLRDHSQVLEQQANRTLTCGSSFNADDSPFITFNLTSGIWESKGNSFLLWAQRVALRVNNSAVSEGFAGWSGRTVQQLGYLFAGPQDATQIGCAIQVRTCLHGTAPGR
jgi:hypothetical protein